MDYPSVKLLAWTLSPTAAFSSPTVCRISQTLSPADCARAAERLQSDSAREKAWGAHFAAACHYAEHPETLARFVWDSEPFWVGHAMVDAWVMRPIAPSNLIRE